MSLYGILFSSLETDKMSKTVETEDYAAILEERKERQLMETLMQLPDFDRYPLPEHFYAKYNIPKPRILSLMEALHLQTRTECAPGDGRPIEIRAPAPGGVRPLIEVEPVKMEAIKKEDEVAERKESEGQNS
jgi:hypothetical protein